MKKIFMTFIMVVIMLCSVEVSAMEKREVMNFNTGWLYSPSDYTNAHLKNFNDSGFEEVCVPHANTVLKNHKGESGRSFLKDIASYRFVSWYRRHFTLGEEYQGKTIRVSFEAVANVAEVYVNGEFVGEHKGAYTGFTFDITDYVRLGEDNVVAVRVDSTRRTDVPPEGGSVDYCLFGGIVREVNMIVTDKIYIENIFVTTPEVSEEKAIVKTEVSFSEDADFEVSVFDEEAKCVASGKEEIEIENPHLWSVDDPYLYTVEVKAKKDGVITDTYETKIGIRWFEFTDSGMNLNGEEIKIMGINRHEQWPWQGRAVPNKLQAKDADMIKETGFNAVRCSHYPQDPAFLDRCDEIGLIVFEEAPGWQHIGNSAWQEVYKENIREMIIRDRNHPSIFSWGVRVNESNDNDALYEETNRLARELDPTRPTHGARRQDTYEHSTYYEDIYTAHYIYPENPIHTPFLVTEHSWDCWTNGYGFAWATDEQALAFTKDFADKVNYYFGNDKCAGGFAWSMFDYDNEVNYTRTNNVFYSGLYDIFRLPKMASNLYISQKDPKKSGANIYIANYWDDDSKPFIVNSVSGDIAQGGEGGGSVTEGETFSVTVMSNCDEVVLYVNGEKVDKEPVRQYLNLSHPFFVFEGIEYEEGEVTAVGYIDGQEAARYTQRTPGKAYKLILTPDYDTLVADGTDMTQVTVSLVDENGTLLPLAQNEIKIEVMGAGEFIGEETIKLEGGRCAFIVKSKYMEEGTVSCYVSAEGVSGANCTIEVLEYIEENSVPFSEGEGTIEPKAVKEYNDTESNFEYTSDWLYIGQSDCYSKDNHYSDTKDGAVTFKFTGSSVYWYGSTASNHGIMAISIDNGKEVFVDCYSKNRKDNKLLYMADKLTYGEHTITVRVTGDKNADSTGYYINADHVKVSDESNFILSVPQLAEYEDGWVEYSGKWSINDKNYNQAEKSGDNFALCEKQNYADGRIQCEITIPETNGGGVGIIGRAKDKNNFYLLELKVVNNTLTWAIWLNENNAWTSIVGGPLSNMELGESAFVRLDMNGNILSAHISSDGENWHTLGACEDSSYLTGFIGVRTHSSTAVFGKTEISLAVDLKYEIISVEREDGVLKSIVLKNYKGETFDGECVIVACYEKDTLIKALKFDVEDEIAVNETLTGDKTKIFVWNGLKTLSNLYEIN